MIIDFIRDDEFYMSLVTFKVDKVVFRVPVEAFLKRSEAFRNMFALPIESLEGRSDETPIVLEGVKSEDFKSLLRFLYPKVPGIPVEMTLNEWMGVHSLAHMWGFEHATNASRAFLVNMDDSIMKVELGTRYHYDDWLRKAYEELAMRPEPLSIEEVTRIGITPALHVTQVREEKFKALSQTRLLHEHLRMFGKNKNGVHCPHCSCTIADSWYEDWEGSACPSCDVMFYLREKDINERILQRVRAQVLEILPGKEEKS